MRLLKELFCEHDWTQWKQTAESNDPFRDLGFISFYRTCRKCDKSGTYWRADNNA